MQCLPGECNIANFCIVAEAESFIVGNTCRLTGIGTSKHALRVHVPKWYILWPQSTHIGTTLRPTYILFGYMDPQGVTSDGIPSQKPRRKAAQ